MLTYKTEKRVCPRLNLKSIVIIYTLGYIDDKHLETFGILQEEDSCRKLLKILQAEQCPASVTILRERLTIIMKCSRYFLAISNYRHLMNMNMNMKNWNL